MGEKALASPPDDASAAHADRSSSTRPVCADMDAPLVVQVCRGSVPTRVAADGFRPADVRSGARGGVRRLATTDRAGPA